MPVIPALAPNPVASLMCFRGGGVEEGAKVCVGRKSGDCAAQSRFMYKDTHELTGTQLAQCKAFIPSPAFLSSRPPQL